jgi:hypothetical protein
MTHDYSRQKSLGDSELIMNDKITIAGWVRSSRCVPNNNCVEVRVGHDEVGVRDSKNTGAAMLAFRRDRWAGFLLHTVR